MNFFLGLLGGYIQPRGSLRNDDLPEVFFFLSRPNLATHFGILARRVEVVVRLGLREETCRK